jgi:Ca2+/Na+ antiporter
MITRGPTWESMGGCLVSWTLKSVLILIAVIVFVVDAIGVKVDINLIALGLALFAAAFIVPERNLRQS